jgi:L-alanine-DL-glutamate epimerase-like enolase superfamily enzyme
MDQTEHPVRDSIFTKAHAIKDGSFLFNNLPGLGVEIDAVALQKFIINTEDYEFSSSVEVE